MMKALVKHSVLTVALCSSLAAIADYPVGVQDKFTALEGKTVTLDVLDNDTGENLRLLDSNDWTLKGGRSTINTSPTLLAQRKITYTAPTGFSGDDEFWYVFADEQGRTNAAKVTVTVRPAGSAVIRPVDDEVSVQQNTTIRINVTKNDDAPFARITEFNGWSEKGGQITKQEGFANRFTPYLTYTPPADFVGIDTFWYVMDDNDPGTDANAAKITVNVTKSDSSGSYPTGTPDNLKYVEVRGGFLSPYYPLDNDIGDGLRLVSENGYSEKGGRYSMGENSLSFYTPPANFTGQDRIWYVFEDELGRTNFSVITLNVD